MTFLHLLLFCKLGQYTRISSYKIMVNCTPTRLFSTTLRNFKRFTQKMWPASGTKQRLKTQSIPLFQLYSNITPKLRMADCEIGWSQKHAAVLKKLHTFWENVWLLIWVLFPTNNLLCTIIGCKMLAAKRPAETNAEGIPSKRLKKDTQETIQINPGD